MGYAHDLDALHSLNDTQSCLAELNCSHLLSQLTGAPGNLDTSVAVDLTCDLISLNVAQNQLTGTVPPQLAYFSKLQNLNAAYNQMNGTIPWTLGSMDHLRYLDLSWNQLTGR